LRISDTIVFLMFIHHSNQHSVPTERKKERKKERESKESDVVWEFFFTSSIGAKVFEFEL
jgi:hypothetical protein